MAKKRIAIEDLDVPDFAHDVKGGYATATFIDGDGDMQVHVYAPIMPSPRPRVTTRGTFMPSDYRKHCDMLGCSFSYARGWYETMHEKKWPADKRMSVSMTFFSPNPSGDCDNLAKTILDAGQLHRGDEPGVELWTNDSQVFELRVSKLNSGEPNYYLTMLRIRVMGDQA
jgi:Holliday junction resolvase RusA-like endonuclease